MQREPRDNRSNWFRLYGNEKKRTGKEGTKNEEERGKERKEKREKLIQLKEFAVLFPLGRLPFSISPDLPSLFLALFLKPTVVDIRNFPSRQSVEVSNNSLRATSINTCICWHACARLAAYAYACALANQWQKCKRGRRFAPRISESRDLAWTRF